MRDAPCSFALSIEALDFAFVQQQFTGTQRVVIVIVGKRVGADVHLIDKHLAIFNLGVGILDVGPSQAQ